VEKTGLISGPLVSVVCREKAPRTEGVNQRRKHTSAITPTMHVGRAAWAGLREKRGQRGPAGPKAEWAGKGGRVESEEERFLN
jgi:hypothetical protein